MSKVEEFIAKLLDTVKNQDELDKIHAEAKEKLFKYDGEQYPRDGCAITLSVTLQHLGLDVDDTYMAFDLVALLKERGWSVVQNGDHQPGDVGTTCGRIPRHGIDHVYIVVERDGIDKMLVTDNQAPTLHSRYVSGAGGKSPTQYFLRA